DGQATDGDPEEIAREILELRTSDGTPLIWNCHLSSNPATPIAFPSDDLQLPDDKYAKSLYSISSVLPSQYVGYAREMQIDMKDNARAYVFNAQLEQLVEFIDIGTRGPQGQMQ
ncbi:MAG: VWA domain-containing protein, partial [Candidatus Thermoplasmatota archaeon]|nr:VWA domain-containing protein [Candidatus Thermoplasmatota archaeon]